MIDFTVPPELEDVRARVARFVADEVLPAEEGALGGDEHVDWKVVEDLRGKARAAGLFLPHMAPEWGGLGLGPLGMALVSQELGVSPVGALALNCMAPDEGNMHTLLAFGTDAQKERWLRPLAEGRIRSCFAMTEPDAGADPTRIATRATRDGDEWVLNGHKWFITGAKGAAFAIVVAVTNPDVDARDGTSLIIVPTDAPGFDIVRDVPIMGTHFPGGHCELTLTDVRVPAENLLGEEGQGLRHAQHRLGGGRIAHAMRWIGVAQRALDLAAKRALERETFGKMLARHQFVQGMIADSATELYASRLMVLHAAWKIENGLDHKQEVAILKVYVANAMSDIIDRAIQIHGALGVSEDTPLARDYRDARAARIYDGPDEVHRMVVARNALKAMAAEGTTKSATGGLA